MTAVAVCGLGLMGAPVARRLAATGHRVAVWDRTPARSAPFRDGGATVAATPAAAAAGTRVTIVLVSDIAAVHAVVGGPDGAAAGRPEVIVQMSTVAPEETTALAGTLPAGVPLLDAPVTGSVPQAASGGLRVLTGGDEGALTAARPVLESLGEVVHCGPLGAASALKCVITSCVAPMVALLAEALVLADALGIEQGLVLDELERTRVGPLVHRKRGMLESGAFPADSRLGNFAKDMDIAHRTARAHGVPLRLVRQAQLLASEAVAAGHGEQDYAVLARFLRGQHRR